jgi:hypothetical protein
MPPAPFPERLRKLIDRLNKESSPEAHEEMRVLKLILSEIEKQRQGKGQGTYAVKLKSTITIDLINYTSHIRNELADALEYIDPPDRIERIRECLVPDCGRLFWAGTSRKKACDKHVDRVRQANHRRDIKDRKTAAAAKRRKQEVKTTLDEMKRTAKCVIRAVMVARKRKFQRIDVETSQYLWDLHGFIPSTRVIRNVTHKLHKDGYLDYFPSAESGFAIEDQYYPTEKLIDLWNDPRLRTEQQS